MLKKNSDSLKACSGTASTVRAEAACQLCGAKSLVEILDFGQQPICNAVLSTETIDQPEEVYPLKLYVCSECFLLQLEDVVPKSTVFCAGYNYLSGTTSSTVRYFQQLAEKIVGRFDVKSTDTVCDIGSNDGTFLKTFSKRNVRVVGVEPTPLPAKIAIDGGIPTVQEFFSEKVGDRLVNDYGKMRVVTAMNVLAHNSDVHSFLKGVRKLMAPGSVFVSQSHYLHALVDELEYDTVYHEHLRYYTLTTLKRLFDMHGFYVFDAEINDVYGGSILVYCSIKETAASENVAKILESETKYQCLDTYFDFAKRVRVNAKNLLQFLLDLKSRGCRIVGVGAPMKSSTLLNYCKIGTEILDYLSEVNPLKIGKYSPGVHVPIVNESVFMDSPPDYALILSWNVSNDIIAKLRRRGFKGKFIIPIPKFDVIG
jgi:2-polyprenyl-3-methyl-5-hydroxy-6-metoxy-1,4-benzoquinol methylase